MKYLIIGFFIMTAAVSAQENWGGSQYIWESLCDPGIDPRFTPDSNTLILTLFDNNYRQFYLDISGIYPAERIWNDSLSVDGYDDISGFMTNDGNKIYFSTNRPGGHGGYDIWISEKAEDEWQIPVNAGSAINSHLDETHPSLTNNSDAIYFMRSTYDPWLPMNAIIFELPSQINSSYNDFEPFISGEATKLYFISDRPNNLLGTEAVWVSWRSNGDWVEPVLLSGEVNNYQIICGNVLVGHPSSAVVNYNSSRIIYARFNLWDCFCAISEIRVAQRTTEVLEWETPLIDNFSLAVYPNPFNSSVNIQVSGSSNGIIAIYDILGREIRGLGEVRLGDNITWDGEDRFGEACPSGIYFVKYLSGSSKTVKNVTLIR
jgi:hypothetical protein